MVYIVAFSVAALIGAIVANLINYKGTTNQTIGHIIGLIVGIAIFAFLISDDGSAFIIRTLAKFNLKKLINK